MQLKDFAFIAVAIGLGIYILQQKRKPKGLPGVETFVRQLQPIPPLSLELDRDRHEATELVIPQHSQRHYGPKSQVDTRKIEDAVISDYVDDYSKYDVSRAAQTQAEHVYPFNTSVYGPGALEFDELAPMQFLANPVLEGMEPVSEKVVQSLKDLYQRDTKTTQAALEDINLKLRDIAGQPVLN